MEKSQLIAELQQAAEKRQFAVVEMFATNAIEQHPADAFGHYYQALCRTERGNYIEASESLQTLFGIEPNHVGGLLLECKIAREQDNIERWGELVQQLLGLDELNPEVQIWAARYNLYQFENEQALIHINRVVGVADNETVYKVRAEIYQNTQQYELALQDLNRCQRYSPNNPLIIKQKIAINTLLANHEAINSDYLQLLALDGKNMGYRADYGLFLMQVERYQEAENQWDVLLEFDQLNVENILKRAESRLYQSKISDAIEDCNTAIMRDPQEAEAYLLLARAETQNYDPANALQALTDGINANCYDLTKLQHARGLHYINNYDYYNAVEDLTASSQVGEYEAEAFYHLGRCYMEQGELDLAFTMWKQADAAFHPDAMEMINTHCQQQLSEEASNTEASLLFMYEPEFETNAQSAIVQHLSGKVWKFSEEVTKKQNATFKEIPAEMQEPLLAAFNKMVLMFSPQGLYIMNPEQTDLRALYRIDEETDKTLTLMSQPLTGAPERRFKIRNGGKVIGLDGFAEDMEFELFFAQVANGLNGQETKAYEQRKAAGQLSFMGN